MAKYNINWLLKEAAKKDRIEYVFFWGYKPEEDGTITKNCLSQWWEASFEVDGITYKSAEHWLKVEKARLFNDDEMVERILKSSSPAKAEKLGRLVFNVDDELWKKRSIELVKEGAIHKFEQNPELKEFLLSTGDAVLAESSPLDNIWGIGLTRDHHHAEEPSKWKGTNLLGFALMEARDELRK